MSHSLYSIPRHGDNFGRALRNTILAIDHAVQLQAVRAPSRSHTARGRWRRISSTENELRSSPAVKNTHCCPPIFELLVVPDCDSIRWLGFSLSHAHIPGMCRRAGGAAERAANHPIRRVDRFPSSEMCSCAVRVL